MERASVVGQVFYVDAVRELCPSAGRRVCPARVADPDGQGARRARTESRFAGEEAFAFRHIVIRDSAYGGLLKRTRAELHERSSSGSSGSSAIGRWSTRRSSATTWNRRIDTARARTARRAGRALAAPGRKPAGVSRSARAGPHATYPAATNLLERAVATLEEHDPARLSLLPDLGEALIDSAEFAKADDYLGQAIDASWESGDERLRTDALSSGIFGQS